MTADATTFGPINEEERLALVRAVVAENPEIVLSDPQIMRSLLAPAQDAGRNVVDLRGALIERLERRLGKLTEVHRDVVEAAWGNLSGMEQIHAAALAAMDAADFEDLVETLTAGYAEILDLAAVRLCMQDQQSGLDDHPKAAGIIWLSPTEFAMLAPGAEARPDPVLLEHASPAPSIVFKDRAAQIQSYAVIRLEYGASIRPGALVLGADDSERFHPAQSTDLLAFLGAVTQRVVRDWLALGK